MVTGREPLRGQKRIFTTAPDAGAVIGNDEPVACAY